MRTARVPSPLHNQYLHTRASPLPPRKMVLKSVLIAGALAGATANCPVSALPDRRG